MTNPISLEWSLSLAEEHRLYALDAIGHPGLSVQTRLSPRDEGYGRWVVDVLDALGLDAPAMIGPSYGAASSSGRPRTPPTGSGPPRSSFRRPDP